MTIRTLFFAVLFISCYSLGVSQIPDSVARRGFGQKDNIVKVENVIYQQNKPRVILVGSSLAALLNDRLTPKDWGNLAINAGSALTGIEIIKKSKLMPETVVVEVNMLMRTLDTELLNNLYSEPMYFFKEQFPMLRLQNHPSTLLFSIVKHFKGEGINLRTEDKFDLGLTYQAKAFANVLPRNFTKDRLKEISKAIESLETLGIKVLLIRFPMSPQVAALPQMKNWLDAMKSHFKAPKYNWIDLPEDKTFVTTDSLHVDTEGTIRVADIIKTYTDK